MRSEMGCAPRRQTPVPRLAKVVLLSVGLAAGAASAQRGKSVSIDGTGSVACGEAQPCFNDVYQQGDKVIFKFTGTSGFDFYNVRYLSGNQETQEVSKDGTFIFYFARPNRTYKIAVQGCNSHVLAHSTCSRWVESSLTTK